MLPRFFCSQPLAVGGFVTLAPPAAHHAARVLRLTAGDDVVLFDGSGGEYTGRIASAAAGIRVEISGHLRSERESPLHVTLAQSLVAADKMDWLVQKAVELGVARIVPLQTQRAVVRLDGERAARRIEHLRQVAIAACEQCGRNRIPEVAPLTALPAFMTACSGRGAALLALAPDATMRLCAAVGGERPVVLLVGPEGGYGEGERQALHAAGFAAVALGPRILRTETAGLAALAALQVCCGDF